MYTGYIVEDRKCLQELRSNHYEKLEAWLVGKLREFKCATGLIVDNRSGKPILEYQNEERKDL